MKARVYGYIKERKSSSRGIEAGLLLSRKELKQSSDYHELIEIGDVPLTAFYLRLLREKLKNCGDDQYLKISWDYSEYKTLAFHMNNTGIKNFKQFENICLLYKL